MIIIIPESVAAIERQVLPQEVIHAERSPHLLDVQVGEAPHVSGKVGGVKVRLAVAILKVSGERKPGIMLIPDIQQA